ncbi:hypothetical protein N752_16065 [Desulforamulus aquiferis]|nr:DUF4342 domain-containing protein [Desulforamulus aquiferis]RYD04096.1 hypothetical protein N752_16065 [Desulforamulus aquiferis]
MTSELEKIDLIRARLGVGYKEAKEALDLAGGDVVEALISLEQKNRQWNEKLHGKGNEFMGQVKHIFEKGQKTKVKVKKDDRTVVEFPATVGALGVLGAMASTPVLIIGALGSIVAWPIITDLNLMILRISGSLRWRFPINTRITLLSIKSIDNKLVIW